MGGEHERTATRCAIRLGVGRRTAGYGDGERATNEGDGWRGESVLVSRERLEANMGLAFDAGSDESDRAGGKASFVRYV